MLSLLEEKERFAYGDLLSSPMDDLTANTLELFAFGNYTHYLAYKTQYLDLSPPASAKLEQLGVLSVLSRNSGNWVDFSALLQVLNPENATVEALENMLISMVDAGHLQVKISGARGQVRVIDTFVLRDAFNKTKWNLRVLREEDVREVDVDHARATLRQWLQEKIIPTRQELEAS